MSHKCKHERLNDKQFDEYRHHLIKKVATILADLQVTFMKSNKCQTDFNSLILTFSLDHIISTIRHICQDDDESPHAILLHVIERISEGSGVKFVNMEAEMAMKEKVLATIQ